ncbi:Coiled-coil domain containing 88C [Mactra antiquata]
MYPLFTDDSFNELKKVLLLILGCAVQCERNQEFVKVIMTLEVSIQTEIMESIKQITDDTESIVPVDCKDVQKLFGHLVYLIRERDSFAEVMSDLAQERDFYQSQSQGKTLPTVSPSTSPEKQMLQELNECKARVRKLKQELDERQEQLSDSREECEEYIANITKLRNENVELLKDARSARSLRDELDILREKVTKVKNYEAEILKYKEKLGETEFYKVRVEELREDNAILIRNKSMLEEQLSSSHKRIETVVELEQELAKKRQQIEELSAERDADLERISFLVEENAQLQFHKKISMNESSSLEQEMLAAKARIAGVGGAIADQLKETTNAEILRLKLENQHLLCKIEDMREASLIENTSLNLQLEKENQRLVKKIEKLQQDNKEVSQKYYDSEEKVKDIIREKDQMKQSLEFTEESAQRQIQELEQQNEDLSQTMEVIRTRNEQTNDSKLKDLEKENKRLHESLTVKNQHLTKLEFEKRQLTKTNQKAQETIEKVNELETEKENIERANLELKQRLQAQEMTCEKVITLEQDYSDVQIENQKLQKKLQNLQQLIQKKERMEQEHINLTVEHQKLQRMFDNSKHSASKVAELENDNSVLRKELQEQQRVIESKKSQGFKLEKMELDLMDLDNENMKLQRQLEITTNRVKQLEKDNSDLDNENDKLQQKLETSKFLQNRMIEMEKINSELEQECMKYKKENSQLVKENKRNKYSLEARENAIDGLNTRNSMSELNHNNVSTLQTDLHNEKIRTQELENELEKFRYDLERLGISSENLINSSVKDNDSRFKALESRMEEILNEKMSMKENRIQNLESRLEESKKRNLNLQEELHITRRECESLNQRMEEESLSKQREKQSSSLVKNSPFMKNNDPNQTNHLVKLERNNASLQVENGNLKSQNDSLNDQIKKLESQNSQLQSTNQACQSERGSLLSQNAKLQVENATLKEHCDSMQSQSSSIQSQISSLEKECKKVNQMYHDLKRDHDQLVQDYESLQRMHNQSTSEYEALISEYGSLKSLHKTVKNENSDLHQQLNNLLHVKDDDSKMREWLSREREQWQLEKQSYGNLQYNHEKLEDDHNRLRAEYDKLKNAHSAMEKENHDVVFENKQLKTEYNILQQDYSDLKDKLKLMETDFNFLALKHDGLYDIHQKTLEDKEQLMNQVKLLINKDQELLSQLLNNKDQMAGQEKSYMEQLADLKRQKERLEEKIMDHYKNRDKQKKNKSFGATLLQKFRNLKRSKSRANLLEGSPDNSSLGSGSFAEPDGEFSKKADKRRYRRRRGSNVGDSDSPRLSKQNWGLAKSTTALNSSSSPDRYRQSRFDMKGARSVEDLLSDSISSRRDSLSNNSSTFMLLPGMGHPVSDDEGGFNSNNKVTSPSADYLSLQEFLAEGLEKSSPKQKRKIELKAEDTESRSSENSDGSGRRRRPAPLPPYNQHQQQQQQRGRLGSVPDKAAISQPDLSMSRMSRVSTGSSGGSSQDVRPENSAFTQVTSPSYHMQPNNTSTPAKPLNSQRMKNFDDMNNTSAFSRVSSADDRKNNSLHEPQQQNRQDMNDSIHYRAETTPERDNRLTADARLEMLTRGGGGGSAFSPTSPHGGQSPHSNYSSPNDSRSRLQDGDMSVRSGQTSSPAWRGQGQRPVKATQAYPRSHSPGRLSQQSDDRPPSSQSQSSGGRKGNILVSRQGARPYGAQRGVNRARPASAFGAPLNSSYNSDHSFNSSMNNARPLHMDLNSSLNQSHNDVPSSHENSFNNGPNNVHSNGPIQSSGINHRTTPSRVERPKSVPPGGLKTPPVPPPRKNKDILSTGRYSVIREPTSPGKPQSNTHSHAQWNNHQQGVMSGSRGQSPMSPGSGMSGPPPKTSNKPPAPKPMGSEEEEQKKNSIWYEYGCI